MELPQPGAEGTCCATDCPVAEAHDVLGGKWTTLIFRDLMSGTRRYSELQRSLVGISPRMLAARLRALEARGLVARRIYPTVPPQTDYTLTDLGRRAEPVIAAMAEFGAQVQQAGAGKDQARPRGRTT
jgi:DNA-binding HxlR family transcriptional regulator